MSEASNPAGSLTPLDILPGRRPRNDPAFPEPGEGCMVCRAEEKAEKRCLQILLEGASEGYLEGCLDGSGAVCMRHLSWASPLSGKVLPPVLVGILDEALKNLKANLDLYRRHHTPEGKDEPWGEERDAPHRAVKRMVPMVGQRGGL